MKKFIFVALLALSVGVAVAETTDVVNSVLPQWFQSGIYVGTSASAVSSTTTNKITRVLGSGLTFVNFGQLDAGCANSAAVTVVGARVDDACFLGHDIQTAATGIPGTNTSATCFVSAADAIKVHACVTPAPDGTAATIGDAGIRAYVISNQ